jgi:16S rRNA (cytosine1402-N4)-methyltransferase
LAEEKREHEPVLREAVLQALHITPQGTYVDATYGRGGHSAAILARLNERGRLLAIDRDPEAVAAARRAFGDDARVRVAQGRFSLLDTLLRENGICGTVDGVLFDLGVSSPQLDNAQRGFSFTGDGPLDMRMDPGAGPPLADWLATVSETELSKTIAEYGEERYARRVARAIVKARSSGRITRSSELAQICATAVPRREPGKHPATRTFQALRIAINDELGELQRALPQASACLTRGGRLVVISFHSLEDRIVKRFMRGPSLDRRRQRLPATGQVHALRPLGKALRADSEEVRRNPRARSAVLRVAERIT